MQTMLVRNIWPCLLLVVYFLICSKYSLSVEIIPVSKYSQAQYSRLEKQNYSSRHYQQSLPDSIKISFLLMSQVVTGSFFLCFLC